MKPDGRRSAPGPVPPPRPSPGGGAGPTAGRIRPRTALVLLIAGLVTLVVAWWFVGRVTADGRRLAVHRADDVPAPVVPDEGRIRVLTWNLAHGRGDLRPALRRNWLGGSREDRVTRLTRIADLLRRVDADVVVLNEVDFDVGWSGGLNQAEVLARITGYGVRVEQRNYDVQLPFLRFEFGNAVLSRIPVREARFVDLPPFSRIEGMTIGAKDASVVRFATGRGPFAVVPVHLEARGEAARLAAVPALDRLRSVEPGPVVLAGDFNTGPARWAGTEDRTAVDELLGLGWRSPRAEGPPGPDEWTFPTYDLDRAVDWILVEPPLRVLEARPVRGVEDLSDHVPVLAVVEVPSLPAPGS